MVFDAKGFMEALENNHPTEEEEQTVDEAIEELFEEESVADYDAQFSEVEKEFGAALNDKFEGMTPTEGSVMILEFYQALRLKQAESEEERDFVRQGFTDLQKAVGANQVYVDEISKMNEESGTEHRIDTAMMLFLAGLTQLVEAFQHDEPGKEFRHLATILRIIGETSYALGSVQDVTESMSQFSKLKDLLMEKLNAASDPDSDPDLD